jgi:RNA polymerase sigma-70 factor (ECF subfamily)
MHDPLDEAAWHEFVRVYGPRILAWCRHWALQPADAQDVTREVLRDLAEEMRGFTYDPAVSFRHWLRTLARNAWSRWVREQHIVQSSGDTVLGLLGQEPARDDLVRRLEEQYDHELLEQASGRVRLRVELRIWEAFRLTAQEGLSGSEAAKLLGIPASQVYVARHRVERMLCDEVEKLDA